MTLTETNGPQRRQFLQAGLAVGSAAFLVTKTAFAQTATAKIFVASSGSDSNDGSRNSPKRSFQAAHNAIGPGGEIVVLDTAGYGAVSISKDLIIAVPPGVNGFVTPTSGAGITVGSGLKVTLRGLIIEAGAANLNVGVSVASGTSLVLDGCTISGFGNSSSQLSTGGIVVDTSNAIGTLSLYDTTITNCSGCAICLGFFGNPTDWVVIVDRCKITANRVGLFFPTNGKVTVRNTVVANQFGNGIQAGGYGSSSVRVNVEYCVVTGNGATGIAASSSANVTVSNTAITGNFTGVSGGPQTFGNNQLANNTTDGSMGPSVASK